MFRSSENNAHDHILPCNWNDAIAQVVTFLLVNFSACKGEFQPPIGRTHSRRFSFFYKKVLVRYPPQKIFISSFFRKLDLFVDLACPGACRCQGGVLHHRTFVRAPRRVSRVCAEGRVSRVAWFQPYSWSAPFKKSLWSGFLC